MSRALPRVSTVSTSTRSGHAARHSPRPAATTTRSATSMAWTTRQARTRATCPTSSSTRMVSAGSRRARTGSPSRPARRPCSMATGARSSSTPIPTTRSRTPRPQARDEVEPGSRAPLSRRIDEGVSFRFEGGDGVSQGLTDLGRFAEPSLYILLALADGPKHGYAIMTDVESMSGVPLGPGTLYGALARLEQCGLIEALEPVERRRPYRLTGAGATTLKAQLDGLAGFARMGLARVREASE